MNIPDLITTICILVPGIYLVIVLKNNGTIPNLEFRELFAYMIVYNFLIAGILLAIYSAIGWDYSYFDFVDESTGFKRSELIDEILISACLALILQYFLTLVSDNSLIQKLLVKLRATRRTSSNDVWKFVHEFEKSEFEYCDFYDIENNLVYKGFVLAYSISAGFREVLLLDVEVFDLHGTFKTRAPYIYVSCPENKVRMDFYKKENN